MMLIFFYIYDFFAFIFEALKTVVGFITSIFSVIGSCLVFLKDFFGALPVMFWVPFLGLVAIGIVYKVLGREGAN